MLCTPGPSCSSLATTEHQAAPHPLYPPFWCSSGLSSPGTSSSNASGSCTQKRNFLGTKGSSRRGQEGRVEPSGQAPACTGAQNLGKAHSSRPLDNQQPCCEDEHMCPEGLATLPRWVPSVAHQRSTVAEDTLGIRPQGPQRLPKLKCSCPVCVCIYFPSGSFHRTFQKCLTN